VGMHHTHFPTATATPSLQMAVKVMFAPNVSGCLDTMQCRFPFPPYSRIPCHFLPNPTLSPHTGVGALLVRRDAAATLHVVYFGGGSVLDATAEGVWRMLMPLPEGLETGTMPFLDIIQLKHGFEVLNKQMGGMKVGDSAGGGPAAGMTASM
jgi:hypothetical protein